MYNKLSKRQYNKKTAPQFFNLPAQPFDLYLSLNKRNFSNRYSTLAGAMPQNLKKFLALL